MVRHNTRNKTENHVKWARKLSIIGAAAVLVLVSVTSPLGAVTEPESVPEVPALQSQPVVGNGPVTPQLITELIGEIDPQEEVGVIKYTPEPVRESMTWEELSAELERTAFGESLNGPVITTDHPACVPLCGYDEGYGVDEPVWSFPCDDSSAFIGYDKSLGPGATFVAAADFGPADVEVCDGFYGPTLEWEVTMSVLHLAPFIVSDGCYSDVWMNHEDGFCPGRGSALTTFNAWQVSGPGAMTTLDLPGLWLDYFVGKHADTRYV